MIRFEKQIAHLFATRFNGSASAIVLTGSQAKGFATAKSDIDLIVLINDDSEQLKNDTFSTEMIDGHRAEILHLEPSYIKKKLDRYLASSYDGITYDERKFIEKLRSAVPIVGAQQWNDTVSNFSSDLYEASVLRKSLAMSSKIFDDAAAHYLEGDYLIAVDSVRSLLQHEIESLLCLAGDTSERRRWLLKRLEENSQIDRRITTGFAEFCYNMINNNYGSLKDWADAAMRYHQYAQLLINLQITDEEENYFTEYQKPFSGGFVSPDWLYIVHTSGQWFSKTLDRNVVIDKPIAMILMFCHVHRSEEQISTMLSNYLGFSAKDHNAERVKEMLTKLSEAGLLIRS
ncbi:nucleotidyltransferase domain-containing protein [Agrobacterium tumefaciens]|uniref:nucleotidyltransferase domain-containing protein n=1 Tax=Agrobacterium tumefaciens TaxID=358 RepID=UPI00157438B8|nr:nucleotidyltransferase domain-containing protein [Agrobacterium tumefaciens]